MDVERLIEEVRQFPVLYDQTHEKYRDAEQRERIWKKISTTLKSRDGGEECKKKWSNIRDQFRKTLKKRKIAFGQAPVHHWKYKYEDLLDFLVPYLAEREIMSNVYSEECGEDLHEPECIQDMQEEDFNVEQSSEQKSNGEEKLGTQSQHNHTESRENSSQPSQSFSAKPSPTPVKKDKFLKTRTLKRKMTHHETKTESAASQLMAFILARQEAEKQAKRSALEGTDKNPVDVFLAGIAPPLKSLSPILLNQAKSRIFSIVQEFEMKQLMDCQGYMDYQIPQNIPPYSPSSSAASSSGTSSAPYPLPVGHQSNHPESDS